MNQPKATDLEFVGLTPEGMQALSDDALARAYMRAVLLNHRARLEGQRYARFRDASLPYPEQTQALQTNLSAEIERRGKIWQVSLVGETWLDDAPGAPE